MNWAKDNLPDQSGKTVIVTGASLGGLGHYTALELARKGAQVVLAGRNPKKVEATRSAILTEVAPANLTELHLDLASLDGVRRAARDAAQLGAVDVLINNAGIMAPPLKATEDGFELTMATNHFGPFLFTGLLLPQLVESGDGRVVTVSSQLHRIARKAPLSDPRVIRRSNQWTVYGESKLANLLFTYELERRLRTADLPVKALAAHPGFAGTHLAANGRYGTTVGGKAAILDATIKAVSQPAPAGAWPSLMAATEDLPGGSYCGPSGPQQLKGFPTLVESNKLSHDEGAQRRLWEISEEAVGLSWP